MSIRGAMHTATIWTRSGGQWLNSGTTLRGRLQAISAMVHLQGTKWPESTHLFIANPSPVVNEGTKLVIANTNYYVHGTQMAERPGVGAHHQEIYLSKSEA